MATATLQVVGIGNAIVDILAQAEDSLLGQLCMAKGGMCLIDEARSALIYAAMGSAVEMSGGSAANTVAGIASLGGRSGFIGKVKDDTLGRIFRHDITAAGVTFRTPAASDGPATGTCLILVTGDAQRTMNTFLGACGDLEPGDIDRGLIESANVTYLEGYLFDRPPAQAAFRLAAEIAHEAGRKVALSLSDRFCVDRHRAAFLELVDHHIDILFANEGELLALFETGDVDAAIARLAGMTSLAVVTRGAEGSLIVAPEGTIAVPAAPVGRIVDTTGAGDLYAAGFLHALTQGRPLAECGRLGSLAAAEIISHYGARPETPLLDYVARCAA
jgi:sugar/nucleoside kinase (ribokinase family)